MLLFNRAGKATYAVIASAFSLFLICANVPADELWTQLFEDNLERAQAGDADAQYEVGVMYLKGQGVEQNRSQAIKWFTSSSQAGNDQATTRLRRMSDQEDKFQELLDAAEGGDTAAQHDIAMMYLKGRGIQQDLERARAWFARAAKQGDEKAITRLGILYYKGDLGNTDYAQARQLFERVSSGSVLAQYYLGEMYAGGHGVEKSYATATEWYQKAADGGFKRALGKIINLEEELKMEQRRDARRAARDAEDVAAAQAGAAAPAAKAEAAVKARPAPKAAAPAKPVTPPVPAKPARSALQKLAAKLWLKKDEPVAFLPSTVTSCELEGHELVCFSEVLQRTSGRKIVQYRVKSIIKSPDERSYNIAYRNLVLDVVVQEDDDDQPLGYDSATDQGFRIQTGWTREHHVECQATSNESLQCVKDKAHSISVVAGQATASSR